MDNHLNKIKLGDFSDEKWKGKDRFNLNITEFDLSNYVFKINQKFGKDDISNQHALKSVIEY
jgi:hypothetical protein